MASEDRFGYEWGIYSTILPEHEKQFQCWIRQSGSEQSLYLAILPLFESSNEKRMNVIHVVNVD